MSAQKKSLLLIQPRLCPPGGGIGVAAWMLQALVEANRYDVTLISSHEPDLKGVDSFFGTRLEGHYKEGHFSVECFERVPRLVGFCRRLGLRASLLEIGLFARLVKRFMGTDTFDYYVSTSNEWAFPEGAKALQYIHYPTYHQIRGATEYRWFHRIPGVIPAYQKISRALSQLSLEDVSKHTTLVNSSYVAQRFQEVYGTEPHIVYPPCCGTPAPYVSWSARQNRFVALGRFSKEKENVLMVQIIQRVRALLKETGASDDELPELHLIGSWDRDEIKEELLAQLEMNGDWLKIHIDLSRDALETFIAESRYGIHCMVDEHFGMAVAELQRAGCVTFVADNGGPVEIVGGEERQLYRDKEQAIERILTVLSSSDVQEALHQRAVKRADLFSCEQFTEASQKHVAAL